MENKGIELGDLELCLLPPQARELAALVGLESTLALVENYGGLTLRIPHGTTRRGRAILDEMAEKIGDEACAAIAEIWAGSEFYVPNCRHALIRARDMAMRRERGEMRASGFSDRAIVAALVRKYRLSDRYVWRLLRRKPPPDVREKQPRGQANLPGI